MQQLWIPYTNCGKGKRREGKKHNKKDRGTQE
jgi:hypothetical protein